MAEEETADAGAKSDASMKSIDHQSPAVKRAEAGSKVEGTLS
jgi:hypothetical protein